LSKYTPGMAKGTFDGLHAWGLGRMKDGKRYVEKYRREAMP